MSKQLFHIDWSSVEKALEQDSPIGRKMAIIETDKIFGKLLEKKKFPGDTIENSRWNGFVTRSF